MTLRKKIDVLIWPNVIHSKEKVGEPLKKSSQAI